MTSVPKAFQVTVEGVGLRPTLLAISANLLKYRVFLLSLAEPFQAFSSGWQMLADG